MARLLYDQDSAARHINGTRRHIRLSRQQNKPELADAIKPMFDEANDRLKMVDEKNVLREDAYDDVLTADSNLDDAVRNAFTATQTHDRNAPAAAVMRRVFPDEKFGDIVNTPMFDEPAVVEQLAIRFEALGESHPLYAQAAMLREKIEASRQAISAFEAAVREVKVAEAEAEIALANLRRQYEANYLNARREYGKLLAERLFPRLTKSAPAMVAEAA